MHLSTYTLCVAVFNNLVKKRIMGSFNSRKFFVLLKEYLLINSCNLEYRELHWKDDKGNKFNFFYLYSDLI